ncbi:putative F-box/LRR-repeat protein At3g18150 [Hevea brasiliensis]|uniref:putative F-box/LRR-repeat protein At3g18150 n=1 Tax=Hevea brasiliensis TaxID=3981 RepID=UPI0025E98664|nr:putative F-box/LRR-repeat protein At3g18150 [Hevea brasiliensis]
MHNQYCRRVALEDHTSSLPDDILLHILSLLRLREAVATSFLSRRWRYLWTSIPKLNFELEEIFPQLDREAYIKMVNQVLKLYKGSNLHEFSIHYPLLENSSCHIDLWVAFAIATGVSRLELNFSFDAFWKNEIIPRRYGDESKGKTYYLLQLDRISSVLVSPLIAKNRLKSFKEIILNCVHTTDSSFETILSACSSLERLVLFNCQKLINAKHTGQNLKLKFLEIFICRDLENMEIFAPDLIAFKYNGPKINISLQGAQQLVNVCAISFCEVFEYPCTSYLGLPYPERKDFVFGQFAIYLSQLEHLMMDVSSFEVSKTYLNMLLFSLKLSHLLLGW